MKKILTKQNISAVFDALMVIAGTFLMGFAFNVFLNANKISPSGFSGLSAIISNLLAMHLNVQISASVIYLSINAALFIIAFKSLGLKFAINSAIGIISYSIFMEVCNFSIGLTGGDLFLYAIYGGVIMGVGLGLVFRGKGSTGGSDMLANLLNKKFRFITVGNFVFIVDFVVIALSYVAYGDLTLSLYSLVAIYIMTKMSDVIISGVNRLRAYYIISSKYEEISMHIMNEIERGVTGFKSQGMYTHNKQYVLMTIVTRAESARLRQLVANIDKNAFMFSAPISEAMGSGFMPLANGKGGKEDMAQEKAAKIEKENNQPNNQEKLEGEE